MPITRQPLSFALHPLTAVEWACFDSQPSEKSRHHIPKGLQTVSPVEEFTGWKISFNVSDMKSRFEQAKTDFETDRESERFAKVLNGVTLPHTLPADEVRGELGAACGPYAALTEREKLITAIAVHRTMLLKRENAPFSAASLQCRKCN